MTANSGRWRIGVFLQSDGTHASPDQVVEWDPRSRLLTASTVIGDANPHILARVPSKHHLFAVWREAFLTGRSRPTFRDLQDVMKKTDLVRFPYRLNAAQDPDHFRAIVLSGEQQTRVLGWINPRDSGSRRICYDSPTGIAFLADRDCPQLVLGEYDTVDEVVATYGGIEDDSFGTLTEERARGAKNARTLEIEAQQIELSDSTLGSLPSGQSQGATR